jgi:hypothetical protein
LSAPALPFRFDLTPLSDEPAAVIRANLEQLEAGNKVRLMVIGALTAAQLTAINDERRAHGYAAVMAEVVFMGRHLYSSRIERDGYTIDDVLDQIKSGMDSAAVVLRSPTMTAIQRKFSAVQGHFRVLRATTG